MSAFLNRAVSGPGLGLMYHMIKVIGEMRCHRGRHKQWGDAITGIILIHTIKMRHKGIGLLGQLIK